MKKIGILGGMGPEATALFYKKIVKNTLVKKDQDHLPTLIYSNPKIPSRTHCLLHGEHKKIISELQLSAKIIEAAGASFIVIPCNTVHYYLKEIQKSVKIPVLNMIEETAKYVNKEYRKEKRVGLLSTKGTIFTKIYPHQFKKFGIRVITPKEKDQEEIMEIIENIKARGPSEKARKLIEKTIKSLRNENQVKIIILGCTELPLLFPKNRDKFLIDPMNILAKVAIKKAGGKVRVE